MGQLANINTPVGGGMLYFLSNVIEQVYWGLSRGSARKSTFIGDMTSDNLYYRLSLKFVLILRGVTGNHKQ